MKLLLAIAASFVATGLCAQSTPNQYSIVPKPEQLTQKSGSFELSAATVIVQGDEQEQAAANFLNDYLQQFFGFRLKTAKTASRNYIRLFTKRMLRPGTEGRYTLQINPVGIEVSGDTYQGTFYGVQSVIQLLPAARKATLAIPCAEISDAPAFQYRGLHLDVSRHFMPLEFVKKYIDYIAYFKMNTFHWHLTDDQGWRIEIKKYPKLTSVGAWRDGTIVGRYPGKSNDNKKYGGFYTQEEIRELVQYAKNRYITVIPEIELPGHASAAIAAYPELSCFPAETTVIPTIPSEASKLKTGKKVQETWGVFEDVFCPAENTFTFLQDVLDEVMTLFPAEYIHIGGDECPKESWKRSAFCQQLIKEKGLKDEHGLQSYFIQRIEQYINSKGRKIIGWDEILEGGLAPNATVMSWRGEDGGIAAAKQGHDVIMTPGTYCYLDHSQSKSEDSVTIGGYLPLEMVYNYNPVPAVLSAAEAKHIMGAQGNVWTEYMESPSKVAYMIFPRLAALSEVLWTKKENKGWEEFQGRLPQIFKRLDFQQINYSKAYFSMETTLQWSPLHEGLQWAASTNMKDCRILATGPADTAPREMYHSKHTTPGDEVTFQAADFYITQSGDYTARLVADGNPNPVQEIRQTFSFNKATAKQTVLTIPAAKAYPGNGSLTLTDGIQNKSGLSRSIEFLGFNGKDCEATIAFEDAQTINTVKVHTLQQKGSWIYLPGSIEIATSVDGVQYVSQTSLSITEGQPGNNTFQLSLNSTACKYMKVKIKNYGTIPTGQPGAGNPAWLFVDEIEAN